MIKEQLVPVGLRKLPGYFLDYGRVVFADGPFPFADLDLKDIRVAPDARDKMVSLIAACAKSERVVQVLSENHGALGRQNEIITGIGFLWTGKKEVTKLFYINTDSTLRVITDEGFGEYDEPTISTEFMMHFKQFIHEPKHAKGSLMGNTRNLPNFEVQIKRKSR